MCLSLFFDNHFLVRKAYFLMHISFPLYNLPVENFPCEAANRKLRDLVKSSRIHDDTKYTVTMIKAPAASLWWIESLLLGQDASHLHLKIIECKFGPARSD